jgi:hypothetical protein
MALKLALPGLDARGVALARARFRAWWEGAAFDEAAALAAIETAANDDSADSDLFAAPPPPEDPRLDALQRIWGVHRLTPGDEESALPASLELSAGAVLGVFGPGLAGPVLSIAETHLGDIRVFEWREETIGHLRHGLAGHAKRISVSPVDLETFHAPGEAFDGLISLDDFAFADSAQRLAAQYLRALKPKAVALVECYCAEVGTDVAGAFASSFREPQLRPGSALTKLFEETGLRVDADEDVTDAHVEHARLGFRRLGDALRSEGPPSPAAARELGWETESWRHRVRLLNTRRIVRRRFRLAKI